MFRKRKAEQTPRIQLVDSICRRHIVQHYKVAGKDSCTGRNWGKAANKVLQSLATCLSLNLEAAPQEKFYILVLKKDTIHTRKKVSIVIGFLLYTTESEVSMCASFSAGISPRFLW